MSSNGNHGQELEPSNRRLTTAAGAPVVDNNNVITAGPRGPMLMQDVWYQEKLAHFHRELIPERRMHAKGSGAYGTFTVTKDITRYTRAKIFSEVGRRPRCSRGSRSLPASGGRPMRSVTSAGSPWRLGSRARRTSPQPHG
jgi:catalase